MESDGLQASSSSTRKRRQPRRLQSIRADDTASNAAVRDDSHGRRTAPRYRRYCWTLQAVPGHRGTDHEIGRANEDVHPGDAGQSDQSLSLAVRRAVDASSEESEGLVSLSSIRRSQGCAAPSDASDSGESCDGLPNAQLRLSPSKHGQDHVMPRRPQATQEEISLLVESLEALLRASSHVSFYIFQLEEAPKTKQLHFQGYTRFKKPMSLQSLKALFLPHVPHFSACKGSEQQNIAYCSKAESRVDGPWSFGELGAPGKRTDVATAREIVTSGGRMVDVIEQVNSYQAIKCAELMLKYGEKGRDFVPTVKWFHGATGTGKTRSAFEECPDAWISAKNLKWWEGYDAHAAVIIDDFRKDFCTFHELLRILDRYPYKVETKGGSRQLLAKTIIITCPWSPEVLFSSRSDEDIGQLLRRITEVKLFGEEPVNPPVEHSACASHFKNIN